MNIKQAKEEIKHTVQAYLSKDAFGEYKIPAVRQRPVLLIGPPGIGKTQIMEQIARECEIGLVAYTITHHTRQSAVGLPFIKEEQYGGKTYSVTEYTMSEIIASVYRKIEESGRKEGILFIDEINCVSETLAPTMLKDGMKEFDEKGTSKLKELADGDLSDLFERIKALSSDDYTYETYSGRAAGMDGRVKFIIETAPIETEDE